MKGLSLIGLPMVGKSMIASRISKNSRMELLDVDDWVTSSIGMHIPEAAKIYGNDFVLKKEEECIESCSLQNKIIATPGSIVYTGAEHRLKKETFVLYLEDSVETILKRLHSDNSKHRKILGAGSLEEILLARIPLYQKWADRTISCQHKNTEDITKEAINIYVEEVISRSNTRESLGLL